MKVRRLEVADPAAAAREIRGSTPPPAGVAAAAVSEIIARVSAEGDAAVEDLTRRFDTGGAPLSGLRVEPEVLRRAEQELAPAVRRSLLLASENVRRVAEAGICGEREVEFERHSVVLREEPVGRAAVYVPGGRAPYPSTVVMGVVTALAAGVGDVAVCSPPGPDGEIDRVVLGACGLTGAREVYRMGGAQAIAALALGTETVPAVDVIVGPGNLYVQEAKRELSGRVGIDSFAGPSDLLVIAGEQADAGFVALDMLAQAEHGPGSLVVVASSSEDLLGEIENRLAEAPETGAVAWVVRLADVDGALALIESFAPEHLELLVPQAEQLAADVTRAGCVFVGPLSATAFGDYIAGSNHTLPTEGSARFASALSVRHFRRSFTEVRVRGADALAEAAAPLARAEGFELHARSMEVRIRQNQRS